MEARGGRGNASSKTYSVTTAGTSKGFEYDANGNLRFEKGADGAVSREYRWDQQNRLVKAIIGGHESAYEYDGASRRVRIVEKEGGVQTKDEVFVWCGGRICQKRASNGTTILRSYFGNGYQESGATNYFTTRDHLGSVREVVGTDGTTVASRLSYDPWGKLTETGSSALSDFTYTGHYYDRATGLTLAQYRGYAPGLGRWVSRDPMGLAGGLNLYGYANSSPVSYIDPNGKNPILVGVGIVVFILTMGMDAPSDTKDAPTNVFGVAMAIAGGLPGACGGAAPVVDTLAGVQANRVAGDAFRDEIARALQLAGRDVSVEVYKRTPFGRRFIDIEVSQGGEVLGGIETKFGMSPYTPAQRAKDKWLWLVEGYRVNVVRSQ